jgi:hypothetical protein
MTRARYNYIVGLPLPLDKSDVSSKDQRDSARFKLRNDDGSAAYPINDCSDAHDAWNLRNNSKDIPVAQIESHVRKAAKALGCSGPWDGDADATKDADADTTKGGRVFYTNAHRDAAAKTLQNIHDNIKGLFPDVCDSGTGADASDDSDDEGDEGDDEDKSVKADTATVELLTKMQERLDHFDNENKQLKADIENLAGQPDMTGAPRRGVLTKSQTNKTLTIDEVNKRAADMEQANYVTYLRRLARSGDPNNSEAAVEVLERLGVSY